MKQKNFRVVITTAAHINGKEYSSARVALITYNNIRALFLRLGYTIADAGAGQNWRAELWTKEGRADRNIEIYAI